MHSALVIECFICTVPLLLTHVCQVRFKAPRVIRKAALGFTLNGRTLVAMCTQPSTHTPNTAVYGGFGFRMKCAHVMQTP